jgi:hypothetical protein
VLFDLEFKMVIRWQASMLNTKQWDEELKYKMRW